MIGVTIPAFNPDPGRLILCIESLLAQHFAVEILLVDDGSDPPISGASLPYDSRLRGVRSSKNQGVQFARNLGYNYWNNCDYLLFCDADVVWCPGALSKLQATLGMFPEAGYVYCDYGRTGEYDGVFRPGPFKADILRQENYISTMSLVRRRALPDPPFVLDEKRLQDWSLWLRMLRDGWEGVYVPEPLFWAHFAKGGISCGDAEEYRHWHDEIRRRYVPRQYWYGG